MKKKKKKTTKSQTANKIQTLALLVYQFSVQITSSINFMIYGAFYKLITCFSLFAYADLSLSAQPFTLYKGKYKWIYSIPTLR